MSCRIAYYLLLLCVLCLAPIPARAEDAEAIRTSYLQLDAAYSKRDVPAVIAFLAPNFVRHTWNSTLNAAQFQAELKDSFDGTSSVAVITRIQSLAVHGDTADAVVSKRTDLTFPKPLPDLPPPYFVIKVTQEYWQKAQGRWRMAETADTPLYETLCLLNERDQSIRRLFVDHPKDPAVAVAMGQIDAADRARLKQIMRQYGWPGFDLVGTDGENIAWEIVQHSDDDKAFQKRCLPLIEAAVKCGQEMPSDLAYLTDRILTGEHKPQVYGTQGSAAIIDPAHVDERRAAVGLAPLAVYEARRNQIYGPQEKP